MPTAAEYRAQAQKARSMSELGPLSAKADLLRIADTYESLAVEAEGLLLASEQNKPVAD